MMGLKLLFCVMLLEVIYNVLYLDNLTSDYRRDKEGALDRNFPRYAYFSLQVLAPVLVIWSLTVDSAFNPKLYESLSSQYFGITVAAFGLIVIQIAKRVLGHNYSPCQDSHVPKEITAQGPYRFVRHPIYAGNILFFAGLTTVSESLWSYVIFVALLLCFDRSAKIEERALIKKFPKYRERIEATKRFIPFVY